MAIDLKKLIHEATKTSWRKRLTLLGIPIAIYFSFMVFSIVPLGLLTTCEPTAMGGQICEPGLLSKWFFGVAIPKEIAPGGLVEMTFDWTNIQPPTLFGGNQQLVFYLYDSSGTMTDFYYREFQCATSYQYALTDYPCAYSWVRYYAVPKTAKTGVYTAQAWIRDNSYKANSVVDNLNFTVKTSCATKPSNPCLDEQPWINNGCFNYYIQKERYPKTNCVWQETGCYWSFESHKETDYTPVMCCATSDCFYLRSEGGSWNGQCTRNICVENPTTTTTQTTSTTQKTTTTTNPNTCKLVGSVQSNIISCNNGLLTYQQRICKSTGIWTDWTNNLFDCTQYGYMNCKTDGCLPSDENTMAAKPDVTKCCGGIGTTSTTISTTTTIPCKGVKVGDSCLDLGGAIIAGIALIILYLGAKWVREQQKK